MEELPDDIVLRIFSMLGANMLLGAVPVVCKRWATLARHPDAWRNEKVDLSVHHTFFRRREALRVLRLAPHLNAVHLAEEGIPFLPTLDKIIVALLEGCLTSLKKVTTFSTYNKHMCYLSTKVLAKFKDSLREVQLFVRWPECSTTVPLTTTKHLRQLVQCVASLPRMTSLEFNFENSEFVQLDQEKDCFAPLSSGCPVLRKVTIVRGSLQTDFTRTAVLHAMRGKTLTEVDLGLRSSYDPGLFAAVAECKSLTKCSIPVDYLPVIKDMSTLRKLTLYIPTNYDTFSPIVQACPVLSSVTELTFAGSDVLHKTALDLDVYQFVESLSNKFRNIEKLYFQRWLFDDLELLSSVLNCWPNLNFLAIIDCEGIKPSVINNLCSLQRMKKVVLVKLSVDTEMAEDELIAAVKSLKQQRRDVFIDFGPCLVSFWGDEYDGYGSYY